MSIKSSLKSYHMPAEWERHEATWLSWPKNKITWPGKFLSRVENIYIEMMAGLLPGEKVNLLVDDEKTGAKVLSRLSAKKISSKNLVLHRVKTVDTWIRDYGPIFITSSRAQKNNVIARSGSDEAISNIDARLLRFARNDMSRVRNDALRDRNDIAFTKWTFNAWGGKYSDLARDNGVVDKLAVLKAYPRFDAGIILEGGSIDVNGRGTLLTTEQCLLNKNRNKHLSRKQIEGYLKKFLGLKKVIWLNEGIEADDTDGHVDDITRFVSPRKIMTAVEPDPSDKNHEYLSENLEILKRSTDQDGRKFEIVELPMPGVVGPARTDTKYKRLPASYANFYIGNHAVLVPIYSHRNDKKALQILKKQFPTRKVIGIECTELVYGLGSIHCVTQQQPSV